MKKLALIFIVIISFNGLAQTEVVDPNKNIVYKETPPDFGKDKSEVLLIILLSPSEIKSNNINEKGAANYNAYVKKHADKIFLGKKEYITSDKLADLDFEGSHYNYIFQCTTLKGSEYSTKWPYKFGTIDVKTGLTYYANWIWKGNHSNECKDEIQALEKARKKNSK